MILLTETDVARLIDHELALSAAEAALLHPHGDHAATHLRITLGSDGPPFRALTIMGQTGPSSVVVKTNVHGGTGADKRSGSLLTLWDGVAATPLALIAAAGFNDHRTAAGFAVAARHMARPDAATLVVFGTGKMAAPTVRYVCRVRPIRRVIIVSRMPERAAAMAARLTDAFAGRGPSVEPARDPAEAAAAADILVTVTVSSTPVFPGAALRSGALVILGGANRPDAREADDDFARRALVVADDAERCTTDAGDVRLALASGALEGGRLMDGLGAFRAGAAVPGGVLGFKSMGLASQDAALAEALVRRARARGIGQVFSGFDPVPSGTLPLPAEAPLD